MGKQVGTVIVAPDKQTIGAHLRRGATVAVNEKTLWVDLKEGILWGTDPVGREVLVSMCECGEVGDRCIQRGVRWLHAPQVGDDRMTEV